MVSVLVERVDDRTVTVVLKGGGGGEGPFKLEELKLRRLLRDEADYGEAGRFRDVLADIDEVCTELDLSVDVTWDSSPESDTLRELERKVFDD